MTEAPPQHGIQPHLMIQDGNQVHRLWVQEHKAVLEDVKRRVHAMTAGVPLNKY